MKVLVEFNSDEETYGELVDFLETCLDGTGTTFKIKDSQSNEGTNK